MRLLVGLGNPGPEYAWNRHNIGFMALDEIVQRYRLGAYRNRYRGLIARGEIDGTPVLALKPSTYMNDSGKSVGEAARFYKIAPEEVIVLYDEIDLAPGKVRVKVGGGNAGHRGLRSIDGHFGKNYCRVRLGIGHPGHRELVNRHVLSDFVREEQEWLDPLLDAVAKAVPLLVGGDANAFMNKVGLLTRPPRPASPAPDKDGA